MNLRNEGDSDESGVHPVVEVTVHAHEGAMTILRLVFLEGPNSTNLSTLQLAVTPLQSLRLRRDLASIWIEGAIGGDADLGGDNGIADK